MQIKIARVILAAGFDLAFGGRLSNFQPARNMKLLERLTLMTVTTVYVAYLIQQATRMRAERVYRLAAGESPYERTHPKPRRIHRS